MKKGLTNQHGAQKEDGEPLKCPICAVIHLATEADKKMYQEVLDVF